MERRIKKHVAGLLSLVLVLTTVFTQNVILAKAEATAGNIQVNITGNGQVVFDFYETEIGAASEQPCPNGAHQDVSSNNTVEIPSGDHGAKSVKISAFASSGYSVKTVTADGDLLSLEKDTVCSESGQTIAIDSTKSGTIVVVFEENTETPVVQNVGDISIKKSSNTVNNNYNVILDGYAWDDTVQVLYSFNNSEFAPITVSGDSRNGEILKDEEGHNVGIGFDITRLACPEGKDSDELIIKVTSTGSKIIAAANFGEDIDASSYIAEDKKSFTYAMSNGDRHNIGLALSYENEGLKEIENAVKNYLFAYSTVNASNLASELYSRFIEVPMFERFGFECLEGDEGYNNTVKTANISKLASRITVPESNNETVSVKLADGSTETRDVYICNVVWGKDRETGNSIESNIKVIKLNSADEFVVSTNWNSASGFGETGSFYLRKAGTDNKKFYSDDEDCCYSITVPSYETIVVGGNAGVTTELNSEKLRSLQFDISDTTHAVIRVLKSAERYIAVVRGGSDRIGGLGYNGTTTDSVWNTGTGAASVAYIGDKVIYLEPLNQLALGLANATAIKDITLKDSSMAEGVIIDKTDLNKIRITFESNFFDSVPLSIKYTDGTVKDLTINRVGLVIQYVYLDDSRSGTNIKEIEFDCKTDKCSLNYDYWIGDKEEEYVANEQILVYATYYHPSTDNTSGNSSNLSLFVTYDNGQTEIISHTDYDHVFDGYLSAKSGEVATTSFIIGFAQAKKKVGVDWVDITTQTYSKGGLSATVLNAGFDNNSSFGGTQCGSGSGVHWDGLINWY